MKEGVKEVKAYLTTDGDLFADETTATDHQIKIDLKERLRQFAGLRFYHDMTPDEVVLILLDHEDEIAEIFARKNSVEHGEYEGDFCGRPCTGIIIKNTTLDGCSCHVGNPPCSFCTSGVRCTDCNYETENA